MGNPNKVELEKKTNNFRLVRPKEHGPGDLRDHVLQQEIRNICYGTARWVAVPMFEEEDLDDVGELTVRK